MTPHVLTMSLGRLWSEVQAAIQALTVDWVNMHTRIHTAFVASDKSARGVLGWIYGDIHCSKSSRRNCSQDLMSSFSGWGMRGSVTTIALSSSLSYRSWSSFCAWLNRAPTEIWTIAKDKPCLAKSKDTFTGRIPEKTIYPLEKSLSTQLVFLILIQWIVIYPVDRPI